MVTRKTSLPYPNSPSAASKVDSFPVSGNHVVDAADVPPIPHSPRSASGTPQASSFLQYDNPWKDAPPTNLRTDRPIPDFLKPRHGQPVPEQKSEHSLQGIPDALRPGRSEPDTPDDSSDSGESRGFWEDDDPEEEDPDHKSPDKYNPFAKHSAASISTHPPAPSNLPPPPPSSLPPEPPSPSVIIKRKPVVQSSPLQENRNASTAQDFASNNPFRRPSSTDVPAGQPPQNVQTEQEPEGKGKQPIRPAMLRPSISDFSKLSIHSGPVPDPTALQKAEQQTPEPDADPWRQFVTPSSPPPPQTAPPPVPQQPPEQPALIPVPPDDHLPNPWASQHDVAPTPSPIPFSPSQQNVAKYNDSLLDRGQENGTVPLHDELTSLPNGTNVPPSQSQSSLIDIEDEQRPPHLPRPSLDVPGMEDGFFEPPPGPPPSKVSRPKIQTKVLSEAEIAKNVEDRNETYQIKHFNWFDHVSGRLRRSSMLTQNKNGPCPLLALVNALILGAKDESQAALDESLRSREQVSLGLIIETLMYELMTRSAEAVAELPDVDDLNAFLMRLRTGMNANPRFVPPAASPPNLMDADDSMIHVPQQERSQQKTGIFEATLDIKLYSTFAIPLVHGWLPELNSRAAQAFARSAPTYEDAQAIQFGEEELEYKLTRQGLNPEEQRVWEDIHSIKSFLTLAPTQLTQYGLESIQSSLPSGSFAILFRNDHFSTIYKHPQSGQLFTLITDAGYADRDEIIWESFVDVSGSRNEFFSGDFMPVSYHPAGNSAASQSTHDHHQHLSIDSTTNAPLSPQEQQEQHDADFAMALQLQEEEEQRQRAEQARRRRSGQPNQPTQSRNSSASNIPITLTRSQQARSDAPESRPSIPPRNSRANIPAVSRPSDAGDEDAPPAYEEAAKGKPYIPPVGSPLHPGSDAAGASPMSSNVQLTGTSSNISTGGGNVGGSGSVHPPGINAPYSGPSTVGPPRRQMRRWSGAYEEQVGQSMPGSYYSGGGGRLPSAGPGVGVGYGGLGRRAGREGDRDCIVM